MKHTYAFIKSSLCIALLGLIPLAVFGQFEDEPIGWASFNGGTTGGAGGDTVVVSTRNELAAFTSIPGPRVILIEDTIEMVPWERMDVLSDITILGTSPRAALTRGGLEIKGDNVIIRNLSIGDSYDGDWSGTTHSTDAITVYGRNVWVDHCNLYASADGLLDIRADGGVAADFVTVSWTKFSNHNKVMLIGSSNDEIEDRGHLKTTIHHCWFDGTYDRGINQRMPRIRFGDIHVYNNYYEDIGSYCIAARFESDVVVENNFFRTAGDAHFRDDIGLGIKDPELVATGNYYELTSGRKETSGDAFPPSAFYDYTPDTAVDVAAIVMNGAGLFDDPDNEAPVAVSDTFILEGPGIKFINATENDTDSDGGTLRIARAIRTANGQTFVRDNILLYAPPGTEVAVDTIWYQLVDTQGGVDTGKVFVQNPNVATIELLPPGDRIDLFPNPTTGILNVRIEGLDSQDMIIRVTDLAGNAVGYELLSLEPGAGIGMTKLTLKVSTLTEGIYILTVQDGKQAVMEKFLLLR